LHFRFTTLSAIAIVIALAFGAQERAVIAAQQPVLPGAQNPGAQTPAPLSLPSAAATGPASPEASPTAPTGRRLAAFKVTADRITFYSNRYVMEADDHVTLTLGDGTRVVGNTLFYDLRLNRLLIAGAVTITAANSRIDGAAFAEYFDFDRAYFLPILSRPDRWTFAAGDYAHPLFGREMPGDTFYLPDLSGERVFLYSSEALVDPHQSVRFTPAKVNFGLVRVPFPSYFLTYSPNPFFAQNALSGAYADGPLDFAGGEHSLATAHIRYDAVDGPFPALELHEVSNNSYVVASANALTRPQKQFNLQTYDRITPGVQIQSLIQENTFQHGLGQPLSATAYANVQLTAALPSSYLQLTDYQYYDSLLAKPDTCNARRTVCFYGNANNGDFVPDHPINALLAWIGERHAIHDLPLTFQLRSSYGIINDTLMPLQSLNRVSYFREFDKAVGLDLATQSLILVPDKSGRHHDIYFTGVFDRQRQWFSSPHHIDTQISTVSLTKVFDPQVVVLASYTNDNTGDFYGAQQSLAYPPNAQYFNFYTGQSLTLSPGFRGFGTSRSYRQQLVFTPSEAIAVTVTMRENDDFPKPLPGELQLIGDGISYVNYGVSPYETDVDLRFRISRVLVVDVSRSEFYNFGGYERLSPQFNIQIEK